MNASELKQIVEQIERLEEEKNQVGESLKETFKEAKNSGYDIGILKKILRLRKMKPEEIQEEEELLNTYREALSL